MVLVCAVVFTFLTPNVTGRLGWRCVSTMTDTSSTDMEAHSGYGILPGDFIKPDPALTPAESRDYVVAEMRRWLTGERLFTHANEIGRRYGTSQAVLETHLRDGSWPAARLYMVLKVLERENTEVLPDGADDRLRYASAWATGICSDYLRGLPLDTRPAAALALGFVVTDKLPSGGTIGGLIPPPRLEPVEAVSSPSASDGDVEVEEIVEVTGGADSEADTGEVTGADSEADTGEEADEDTDEDTDDEYEEVKDYEEDEVQNNGRTCAFLTTEYTVTLPGWALCAMASAATAWFLATTLKG